MYNWSVIHGIKRKPHLSVVWNWYHFVAIAILHQPRPTDSADINTRLQLSDTSSIPPMHGGFLLVSAGVMSTMWNRNVVMFLESESQQPYTFENTKTKLRLCWKTLAWIMSDKGVCNIMLFQEEVSVLHSWLAQFQKMTRKILQICHPIHAGHCDCWTCDATPLTYR